MSELSVNNNYVDYVCMNLCHCLCQCMSLYLWLCASLGLAIWPSRYPPLPPTSTAKRPPGCMALRSSESAFAPADPIAKVVANDHCASNRIVAVKWNQSHMDPIWSLTILSLQSLKCGLKCLYRWSLGVLILHCAPQCCKVIVCPAETAGRGGGGVLGGAKLREAAEATKTPVERRGISTVSINGGIWGSCFPRSNGLDWDIALANCFRSLLWPRFSDKGSWITPLQHGPTVPIFNLIKASKAEI